MHDVGEHARERIGAVPAFAVERNPLPFADRPDPVPDEVWDEAARHYSEPQLTALLVTIATINVYNRLMVATRQIAGEWVTQIAQDEIAHHAAHAA